MAGHPRLIDLELGAIVVKDDRDRIGTTVIDGVYIGDDVSSLARSMSEVGLISPPVVRLVGKRYVLVTGYRRIKAARKLGWRSIPVLAWEHEVSDELAEQIVSEDNRHRLPAGKLDLQQFLSVSATLQSRVQVMKESQRTRGARGEEAVVFDQPPQIAGNGTAVAWNRTVPALIGPNGEVVRMPEPGWLSEKDLFAVVGKTYGSGSEQLRMPKGSLRKVFLVGNRGLRTVAVNQIDAFGKAMGKKYEKQSRELAQWINDYVLRQVGDTGH